MIKKIDRFDKDYFNNLKTQKEKEDYFMEFVQKSLKIMEKGGISYGN